MSADQAVMTLNEYFLRDYPLEAAREIERLPTAQVIPVLQQQNSVVLARIWEHLLPDKAEILLLQLPESLSVDLLTAMEPTSVANLLDRLDEVSRQHCISLLSAPLADLLRQLLEYPADSSGRLMDTRVTVLRGKMTVAEALAFLREVPAHGRINFIFLVDDKKRAEAAVRLQDLITAEGDTLLQELAQPLAVSISALEPRDAVVSLLEQFHVEELPVVDVNGVLLGVIRSEVLRKTLNEASSIDLQIMVGASKEERALSPAFFAARKRILWMHVNLATAFLAASVVGLFEGTIAQFTALAVLMPVVAGMGGNMGSQALAVTIRGLALREITTRHWLRIFFKEARVGALNGLLIALTTSLVVLFWSQNSALALVIGLAMTISLSLACDAGSMVPIVLTRFGQDPAQSSAIFLTTITDITGFMSFLGIATMLSGLLLAA